jgi:hypothetical protein
MLKGGARSMIDGLSMFGSGIWRKLPQCCTSAKAVVTLICASLKNSNYSNNLHTSATIRWKSGTSTCELSQAISPVAQTSLLAICAALQGVLDATGCLPVLSDRKLCISMAPLLMMFQYVMFSA